MFCSSDQSQATPFQNFVLNTSMNFHIVYMQWLLLLVPHVFLFRSMIFLLYMLISLTLIGKIYLTIQLIAHELTHNRIHSAMSPANYHKRKTRLTHTLLLCPVVIH